MAEILGKHYSTLQKWTSIEGCPAFRCGQRPWAWPVEETKVWVREHFNG
jgi:phage terminase Nu1 subunit (DNA packaging protein)